jgi:hypothetical protein
MSLLERRGNRFSLRLCRVDFVIASPRDGFHDTSAIQVWMLRGEGFAYFGRQVRRQQLECLAFVLSIVLQHLPLVVASQHDLGGAVGHRVPAVLGESFNDGKFRPLLAKENFALV